MKKYNILLVVRYPVGGIRTFFRYVYTKLNKENYAFTLIAPDVAEARVLLTDLRELDLVYVAADQNITSKQLFKIVTRVARSGHFDLIHSHGFTSSICSIPASIFTRTPHILTSHDVFTAKQFIGLKGFFKKLVLGSMLQTIDCIHCVSNDARDNLLAYLWVLRLSKDRVAVIKNGIDVEHLLGADARNLRKEFGLPEDSFLIGFLGRFMSQKGFKYLVDALATVKQTKNLRKQPLLLTFGDDGFVREEKANVQKMGLAESVRFLPFISDVGPALKGMDLVVVPSLWEACPLLPMEAMVAGVPVLGTSCIGLREVLENTPARVVPPGDSHALYEALIAEMISPSTKEAKEFALEAARRFNVNGRVADLEKLMLKHLQD